MDRRLTVVPPSVARHKIRYIGSALRGGRGRDLGRAGKVIDLRAYSGRNVIRFPRRGEPHPAA
ncbi:hypothetical protein AB0K60_00770 [Thermopolyspora sp. NPDC052614]|uniref:hypothetical protein n=1 Tax=Thermopolyspora sp. NPDC052614 TaxID=3155682 RepID=UPI0034409377